MYSFDLLPDRRKSDAVKWNQTPEDTIAMWVADMDFCIPPAIEEAVKERASHLYYGYPNTEDHLKELVSAHYKKTYGVELPVEWIVQVSSVMTAAITALEMLGAPFMYSVPMYDHIRVLHQEAQLPVIEVPMKMDENYRFTLDFEALEAALTPEVKAMILCNPHNPVGRMFDREELEEVQAFCKKHNLLIISDEIHCELALDKKHIPFFSLNETAGDYSITLFSEGKICNIPGLPCGFAVIPNKELRERFVQFQAGRVPSSNVLTLAAYEKAYDGSCDEWKDELRDYLRGNRDYLESRIAGIPELRMTHNEGTYLSWIDCSSLKLENPRNYFFEEAKVQFSDGANYGNVQFVRLNFGCPRAQLKETLDRMEAAIERLRK